MINFLIDSFIDQFLIKHWPESSKIMHIVCPVFHNLLQFLWCLWRLFYWVIQCITVLCSYLENRNWSLKRKLHTNPSSISIHFHGNNALHALYYNKFFMVSGSFVFDCRHTGTQAIDWNFHMNLEATRKYNHRTKDWDVKIITVK